MKASKIASIIEQTAPRNIAEKWDNPGFQIGSVKKDIKSLMTVLDIDEEAVRLAVENGVDMIVSHHPFFFSGIKRIDNDSRKGKIIEKALKNDLVLYSAHTNLDKAAEGLNTFIARKIGLKNITPLVEEKETYYKFCVYTPKESAEAVFEKLRDIGVGSTSPEYKNCTFQTEGVGTFEALEGANPRIGSVGELSRVVEVKLETIIKKEQLSQILSDIKRVHPYEQFAYDIIPEEIYTKTIGLGSIGILESPESDEEFLSKVASVFETSSFREAGPRPKRVKKVALCTGAGAEFITTAKRRGADVYITGDLKHHDAQRAEEEGLWVLDVGHFGTEKFVTELIKNIIMDSTDEVEVLEYKPEYGYLREYRVD